MLGYKSTHSYSHMYTNNFNNTNINDGMVSFELVLGCRGGFELYPVYVTAVLDLHHNHIQCMGLGDSGLYVLSTPVKETYKSSHNKCVNQ